MDLKVLRAFLLVEKGGGLRSASRLLNLSRASVSMRLKSLEAEIGVKLFEHRPNKLVLTEKGRSFAGQVERIWADLERSIAGLHENEEICAGNVSVALPSDLAFFFVPRIAAFLKKHPLVKLSMLARSSTETLDLVRKGEVQFGVGRFSRIPASLDRTPILPIHLVTVCPKGHGLSGPKQVSLRSLVKYGLILQPPTSPLRRAIDELFAKKGIDARPVMEAGWCFAIKEYARLGFGVGLVHNICVTSFDREQLDIRHLRHIFGEWNVDLIYEKNRHLSLAHRSFIGAFSRIRHRL